MRLLCKTLLFLLFLNTFFAFSQENTKQGDSIVIIDEVKYYLHIVKLGETAYSLSKNYEISLETLYEKNPNAQYGLRMGESLLIPTQKDIILPKTLETNNTDKNFYIYHQVKKGETYYSIAQKYQIKVSDLRAVNPELTDILSEGASLRIPYDQQTLEKIKTQQEEDAKTDENVYVVHVGETLSSIAKKLNTTADALIKANPDILKGMYEGEAIKIPPQEIEQKQEFQQNKPYHIVKQGETIYSISKQYGIRIDSLLAYNKKIINNYIMTGDTLLLPSYHNIYDFIEYKTDKKEPLVEIANRFQMSLKELQRKNPHLGKNVQKNTIVFIPIQRQTTTITPSQEQTQEKYTIISQQESFTDLLKEKDSLCIGKWDTQKKFTVALMLPFFTNKIHADTFSDIKRKNRISDYDQFKYIPFYQGVLSALDNLAEKGVSIRLNVYDVTERHQIDQILEKPEIKQTDLIITIVYASIFQKIADFSKEHDIPLINVSSPRNNILVGYPNIVKVSPDDKYMTESVLQTLPINDNDNIVMVRNTDTSYNHNANILKTHFPETKEFITTGRGSSSIISYLSPSKENYVFLLSNTETEILDLMRVMDEKRKQYSITLIGYPRWDEISAIDYRYAQNLKLHIIAPQVIDYNSEEVNDFVYKFRARFNSEPNNLAFQGYDLTNYFISGLAIFGKNCLECSKHLQSHLLSTDGIELQRTSGNGYNNVYWNIYTIKDYQIVPVIK